MADGFDVTRERMQGLAAQKEAAHEFLTFTVDAEEYGVDIMTVREIKGWTDVTRLPNAPEFVRGVMNLRGLIIPIFDLRTRFHRGATSATPKHVVIILAMGERNIGILVDTVSDILDISVDQIKAAPDTDRQVDASFISGLISLENRMVVLLDINHLFDVRQADAVIAESAAYEPAQPAA